MFCLYCQIESPSFFRIELIKDIKEKLLGRDEKSLEVEDLKYTARGRENKIRYTHVRGEAGKKALRLEQSETSSYCA